MELHLEKFHIFRLLVNVLHSDVSALAVKEERVDADENTPSRIPDFDLHSPMRGSL